MAGTDEGQLAKLGPFTAGLNNKAQPTQGPVDANGNQVALQEALNVDLDANGWLRRRRGQVVRVEGVAHSLGSVGEYLLAWVDGNLNAYDVGPNGELTLNRTLMTLSDRFVSFTSDDFDAYWTNGVENGRIESDLSLHPFWVPTPDPVSLQVSANGGLAAGNYEVSVTGVDASGRESGASSPVMIALTAGQGITVSLPAAPTDAVKWRIYVSAPNGDVLYRCAERPANISAYAIGAHTPGAQLETAWLTVMPPCQRIRYGHGRIMGTIEGLLLYSEPYRLGLVRDTNHLVVGRECTLMEPVGEGGEGAGWWVADHKRTYFMAGANPRDWSQIAKKDTAAVPGCAAVVSANHFGQETTAPSVFFQGRNGVFYLGLPGGTLMPLREESLALPVDAERGTAALLMFDGIRQMLAVSLGGLTNKAAASDSADITVRRNGVTV